MNTIVVQQILRPNTLPLFIGGEIISFPLT